MKTILIRVSLAPISIIGLDGDIASMYPSVISSYNERWEMPEILKITGTSKPYYRMNERW